MDVKNHDFCPKTLLLKQYCHDAKCIAFRQNAQLQNSQ